MDHKGEVDRIADAYYAGYLLMVACGFLFFIAQGATALILVWNGKWVASIPALGGLTVFTATMFLLRSYRNVVWQRHVARLTRDLLCRRQYENDPIVRRLVMTYLIHGVQDMPATQRTKLSHNLTATLGTKITNAYADLMPLSPEALDAEEKAYNPRTSQIDKKVNIQKEDINIDSPSE
ncbi:MAG: hypothetical protein JW741_08775 [Sedimentisphaerales bacterium]|nr:hypothetical protein [Sedimentisphaerales bacterium]